MKPTPKFMAVNTDELEWVDGQSIVGLPKGVMIKVIAEGTDDVSERSDKFAKFPPGYVEPRHTHGYSHSTLVLEGEMHVAGKVLKPGDYCYGGAGEPHGPFYYPVGCTVYGCGRGIKMDQIHKYKK